MVAAALLQACGGGGGGDAGAGAAPAGDSQMSAAAQLGQKIFGDTALSASGQQSCASCHVKGFAFSADPTASGPDQLPARACSAALR